MYFDTLTAMAIASVALQGIVMMFDEFYFHWRRGLGRWESIGHPVDSLFYLAALSFPALFPFEQPWITCFLVASLVSTLIITKDEWVHAKEAPAAEHFLHALLFIAHPLILICFYRLWQTDVALPLRQIFPTTIFGFMIYQIVFWNFKGANMRMQSLPKINNAFYEHLGERWYTDDINPIALLRAESALKLSYIQKVFRDAGVKPDARVLDIGCGAGLLANPLAVAGYQVRGIDLSEGSLATARSRAPAENNPTYESADAYHLPVADGAYDVVMMLDFLEHVEDPAAAIKEASRVLALGGVFIFHTFNRNLLAKLIVIKAIEVFSKDCPPHMHVYHLFIKPRELAAMCAHAQIEVAEMTGSRPKFFTRAFLSTLLRRRMHPDFDFTFTNSLALGYLGYGKRS